MEAKAPVTTCKLVRLRTGRYMALVAYDLVFVVLSMFTADIQTPTSFPEIYKINPASEWPRQTENVAAYRVVEGAQP